MTKVEIFSRPQARTGMEEDVTGEKCCEGQQAEEERKPEVKKAPAWPPPVATSGKTPTRENQDRCLTVEVRPHPGERHTLGRLDIEKCTRSSIVLPSTEEVSRPP